MGCSGLGAAADMHHRRASGAPGRKVKDRQAPTFAFIEVVLAICSYYSQRNTTDAHVYTQMASVPQVNPAAAEDHHKLCCLDLKGTSMKLIGAFK